jgi:hypothetical protein
MNDLIETKLPANAYGGLRDGTMWKYFNFAASDKRGALVRFKSPLYKYVYVIYVHNHYHYYHHRRHHYHHHHHHLFHYYHYHHHHHIYIHIGVVRFTKQGKGGTHGAGFEGGQIKSGPASDETEEVNMISITDFMGEKGIKHLDILKIDAEGNDHKVRVYMYLYIYAYLYMCICVYTLIYIHIQCTHKHTYTYLYMYICIYIYIHIRI